MFRYLFVFALLCLPVHASQAAIVINEIAWMGTENSSNDEWIELYNTGLAVSVDGWVLSDGFGLEIELAGSIAAGQYAVLERTDDSSSPGSAFVIYTGALGNDGRTLTLRRDDGGIEDQVAGGSDWEYVGGDNITKDTAQLTSGGWITAGPTPGAKNEVSEKSKKDSVEDVVTEKGSGVGEIISLQIPDDELQLQILAPTVGYVHQPIDLTVTASGIGKTSLNSLGYRWNFGNIETGTGKETEVSYDHPGTYVILVEAEYAYHKARARHEITILPTVVSLGVDEDGDVLIHNDSKYEISLQDFVLRGHKEVVFPELSFMAPGATVTIDKEMLGAESAALVALYDSAGEVMDMLVPSELIREDSLITAQPKALTNIVAAQPAGIILATSTTKAALEEGVEPNQIASVASGDKQDSRLPYFGLFGLIVFGILSLYVTGARGEKDEEPSFF